MQSPRTLVRKLPLLIGLIVCTPLLSEPSPAALAAFNTCTAAVESRIARQHQSPSSFLVPPDASAERRLKAGELIIEPVTEPSQPIDSAGAMLHHWRGTAFAPLATAASLTRLLRDFAAYPQHFAPQVIAAHVLSQNHDHMQASMRIRQHHVITVVLDTTYDIDFTQPNPHRGSSTAHSTRITEIASPGTPSEHPLKSSAEHGFLWRQNTWWSYEERDGGLYLQIESVSLSRSIPTGLGWALRPYVESVPRESLEFTLRSACQAIHP